MNSNTTYGDEIFCQDRTDEMYRLELVSKTYDFISQQQLNSLPLPSDARCIDIGSGTGSIVAWLSQHPGLKDGEIVAMDQYVNLLKERLPESDNIKIIQHDITCDDPSLVGQFDLVNIRFVLMHLRERAEILKRITSWVKPGGWLVISDIIDLTPPEMEDHLYQYIMSVMWDVLINFLGTDKNWSRSLQSRFKELGLQHIRSEIYLPPISKGAPMSEFWYLTWQEMRDHLIGAGRLTPAVLEQAQKALLNGEAGTLSPGMLTCIGQKP
ncbi:MAG: class I SAM-dependent methyltransferase [Bacteroides sp.]|nr:class I SAM-dependent methyltransferase [Bacteroides sp.]